MHEQSLAGKQVLITGATNGIGLAAAEALAARGANVALVGRNDGRTENAAALVRTAAAPGAMVGTFVADLSSQAAVRSLADEVLARYGKLDILVNNAGAMYTTRQLSVDDIELTWAVNHLSTFLLTKLLLDRLKANAPSRIITTASDAHHGATIPFDDLNAERSYRGFGRYSASKLANILFTRELARRLTGSGVTANCLHPGFVATGLGQRDDGIFGLMVRFSMLFAGRAESGAQTIVHLASSPDVTSVSGEYFIACRQAKPSSAARDGVSARRLWEESERIAGLSE